MMAMSKTSPLVGLAGAIAATDWPDPVPARAALDSMMTGPQEPAFLTVDIERLDEVVSSVKGVRHRRRKAEWQKRQEREAARQAARARTNSTPRISIHDPSPQPAHDEPEMEF